MVMKSLVLFAGLGLAAKAPTILKSSKAPQFGTTSDEFPWATEVNGTLTSLTVEEGTGCPSGTYHPRSFKPGESISTSVNFDRWVYNSTTSTEPLTCALSINFEFVIPEIGTSQLQFGTVAHVETHYEEDDEERTTNFNLLHEMAAEAGNDGIDGSLGWTLIAESQELAQISANLFPTGEPGEIAVGTLRTSISIDTTYGGGQVEVSQVDIGFGIWVPWSPDSRR